MVYGMVGEGGALINFWSGSSVVITIVGSLVATYLSYPVSAFKDVPKHMKILMGNQKYDPKVYIDKIVDYAQEARRKGLLSLEDKATQEEDPFFRNCIMLIVDAIEPTKAKEMLENELDCLDVRHTKGIGIYIKVATFAPAFGMIGTLIGLINMLAALDVEAEGAAAALGAGMSVALVTTFYGSVLANLFMMPIANRLKAKHQAEMLCKEVVVEGVLSIHAGTNPRHIEERLKAFIAAKERESIGNAEDGEAGEGSKGKKVKAKKPPKEKKAK